MELSKIVLTTSSRTGNTPLASVDETFADGVVTSEFVIDSFSNSDIGSYSCRLENDGTTDTASRDSIVLAIQGLYTSTDTASRDSIVLAIQGL